MDQKNHVGETALYKATSNGHVEVCALLLKNKAHINQQDNTGATPLYLAAENGHVHVCFLLLENNAHVNQPVEDGRSPLHVAVLMDHFSVCTLLLEYNAHVNKQMEDGRSPCIMLHRWVTCAFCYLKTTRMLINTLFGSIDPCFMFWPSWSVWIFVTS